jgi:hypothetical protein
MCKKELLHSYHFMGFSLFLHKDCFAIIKECSLSICPQHFCLGFRTVTTGDITKDVGAFQIDIKNIT